MSKGGRGFETRELDEQQQGDGKWRVRTSARRGVSAVR